MDRITYLIERFWQGKATEEEKKEILLYLKQHNPNWKNRMEQEFLKNTDAVHAHLNSEHSGQIFDQILLKVGIEEQQKPSLMRRIRPFVKMAVAATILVLFGWGISAYLKSHSVSPEASIAVAVSDTTRHVNLGREDLIVELEDGSIVSLTSGSSMHYITNFETDKRDLFLEGEAKFEVAKDTLRPFTVWADGYSTTALGTAFVVSAIHEEVFKVNLLSGKVVVRSSSKSNVALSDVYLEPGQELNIDHVAGLWAVSGKLEPSIAIVQQKEKPIATIPSREKIDSDELIFDKTPLDEVFRRVAKRYGQDIDLNHDQLHSLSFTGSFELSDSLHVVMNIICNMNDLAYYQEDGKLRIEEKK